MIILISEISGKLLWSWNGYMKEDWLEDVTTTSSRCQDCWIENLRQSSLKQSSTWNHPRDDIVNLGKFGNLTMTSRLSLDSPTTFSDFYIWMRLFWYKHDVKQRSWSRNRPFPWLNVSRCSWALFFNSIRRPLLCRYESCRKVLPKWVLLVSRRHGSVSSNSLSKKRRTPKYELLG